MKAKPASAKRVIVVNENHVPAAVASGDRLPELRSDTTMAAAAAATLGLGADVMVGGVGCSEPAVGPGQPVNRVSVAADEFMNECSEMSTRLTCDNEAISVCCPLAQLSALTYVNVAVKCEENDPLKTVKALADTGAEISVIKADLVNGCAPEIMGKIKLQPFCGDVVEADWVKLQISPFTESECDDNAYITVDCAVVCNSNEDMILSLIHI